MAFVADGRVGCCAPAWLLQWGLLFWSGPPVMVEPHLLARDGPGPVDAGDLRGSGSGLRFTGIGLGGPCRPSRDLPARRELILVDFQARAWIGPFRRKRCSSRGF